VRIVPLPCAFIVFFFIEGYSNGSYHDISCLYFSNIYKVLLMYCTKKNTFNMWRRIISPVLCIIEGTVSEHDCISVDIDEIGSMYKLLTKKEICIS